MKDYKLSEVKEICEKQIVSCNGCKLLNVKGLCSIMDVLNPEGWEIDKEQPKDNLETFTPAIDLMKSNYRR